MRTAAHLARFVVPTISMVLVATVCGTSVADAAIPVAAVVSGSTVDARPDAMSAMRTARAQSSRVEDLSARTATSSTFANKDGSWTTESYAGVVRSKTDQDAWVDVDPTIESANKGFEPAAVPFDAHFSRGSDRSLATVASPDGATLNVKWPTDLPAADATGDELRFDGAASGR